MGTGLNSKLVAVETGDDLLTFFEGLKAAEGGVFNMETRFSLSCRARAHIVRYSLLYALLAFNIAPVSLG
jgi:hypothetical protein